MGLLVGARLACTSLGTHKQRMIGLGGRRVQAAGRMHDHKW